MQRAAIASILCALAACGGDAAPAATPETPATLAPGVTPSAAAAGSAAIAPAVTPTPSSSSAPPAASLPASSATPPAAAPGAAPPATPPAVDTPAPANAPKMAMDECGLKTQYPGDEYCILPPPADKGFQVHIGPSNYDSPEAMYILKPGEENVINLNATTSNDKDVQYYFRQYRMRPGSHHVIMNADGRSIGGTQNLARDQPDFGIIPPENEDVGLPMAAHTQLTANMHFYNFTEKPMIRELWINYWYKDPSEVKETANRIFSMTGVSAATAHSHVVVGATCPISGTGRVLSLSGHRHLNNIRFSVWLNSGGQRNLVFADFDSEHPGELEYNSLAKNPMPDAATKLMGGSTGILGVKQGDTFDFECEIINDTDKNFRGLNEAQDDEMCILTGDVVGATVSAGCQAMQAKRME